MSKKISPKVSIIIPVYNGENYLADAIKSALSQTYKNIEIIVVNDGSNDNGKTKKIAESFGDSIKYIEKENGGVSSALNRGIMDMTGEYFSWLSHDDIYLKDKVENQIEYLRKNSLFNQKVILYANYDLIDSNSRCLRSVVLDHSLLGSKLEYSLLRGCVNGITLLIPRKAFDEFGLFDTSLKCTQDYSLWSKMIKEYEFIHMEEILTQTRIHPLQDSNKNPNVINEGNTLWINMIEGINLQIKRNLEGTEYNFYFEMKNFLESTPYEEAKDYCDLKMQQVLDKGRKEIVDIKVSVVIPFYNRLSLLVNSLNSVLSQSHKNLEIILINDGSDEDISPIKTLIERDSRVILFSFSENHGASSARNKGIELSTGKYIAFLDSDDEFDLGKISEQLLIMEATGGIMSHTSYLRRSDSFDTFVSSGKLVGSVVPRIISSCPIATPTVMVRTSFLRESEIRFIENYKIGEDICFWLEILKNNKLYGINKALTVVNVNEFSSAINIEKQLKGISNILKFVLSYDTFSQYYEEISELCMSYYNLNIERNKKIDSGMTIDNYYKTWNRKKPLSIFGRAIFLFKYQGVWTTLRKAIQKYSQKFLRTLNIFKS